MSTRLPMELRVAGWMADEAGGPAPDDLIAAVLERTTDAAQRPELLARVVERPMHVDRQLVVGSFGLRLGIAAAAALLAVLAFAAALLLVRPALPDDWPGFRGGADHAGVGQSGPAGRPVLRWKFAANAPVTGNLAVSGDLVLAPSDDGVLHALDIKDGTERWRWDSNGSITGPTVDGGMAYLADGVGVVHAIDLGTGTEAWQSPLGLNGASVIAVGGDALFVGTGDGVLLALDRNDGAERWRHTVSTGGVVKAPALAGDLVVAATDDGTLMALRADSGQEIWADRGLTPPLGTPVIADGLALIGPPGGEDGPDLAAFGLDDGGLRWQAPVSVFSPSIAGDLGVNGSNDGIVMATELRTGHERWRVPLAGINRPPAVAGSVAYVAADGLHQVVALDARTGGELWRFDVAGGNGCCIAVARGLVLAGTDAGFVYAIGGDGSAIAPSAPANAAPVPSAPARSTVPAPSSLPASVLSVRTTFTADQLGIDQPIALAVAPSGDIYVTDRSDHVTHLGPDGTLVGRWGGQGTADGRFDFVPAQAGGNIEASIAVGPDNRVYVSDLDNHRVQVFTPDGDYIRQFGSVDRDGGSLDVPFDLGVDRANNVYVQDDGEQRLSKFDAAGRLLWTQGVVGAPAFHGHLHGVVPDADGNVLTVNDDVDRALVFDPSGRVIGSWSVPGCSASLDAAGNAWFAECGSGFVRVFDPQHRLAGTSSDLGIWAAPQFGPNGEVVALDDQGDVLLLDVHLP
jgi:outer membrane protein assembly factor BamB